MQIQESFMRSIDNIIGYSRWLAVTKSESRESNDKRKQHVTNILSIKEFSFAKFFGFSLKTYFPQAWGDPQRTLESIFFFWGDFLRENLKKPKNPTFQKSWGGTGWEGPSSRLLENMCVSFFVFLSRRTP